MMPKISVKTSDHSSWLWPRNKALVLATCLQRTRENIMLLKKETRFLLFQ